MTKTKKGTSLVELLAVIVIMGIIAAIAVPTVGALLKNTRKKAAGSDIVTVIQSIDTYLAAANSADKTVIGVTGNTFTLTFGTETATEKDKITAIFDEDLGAAANLSGTMTITLNAAGNKISNVSFAENMTYTKDQKVYTGFKYSEGVVTVKEEANA